MRKKLLKASSIAVTLVIVGGAFVTLHSYNAFASSQSSDAKPSISDTTVVKQTSDSNGRNKRRQGRFQELNVVSEAAMILEVKPIWIMDEMNKGKTLTQIAQDKGITESHFFQMLVDLETEKINEAVSTGKIPQEHADALLSGMTERLTKALDIKAVDVNDHNSGMTM